jgi:hypothetical protein
VHHATSVAAPYQVDGHFIRTLDILSGNRVRLGRFDTRAEAQAALAKALERGERTFVQPPLADA